MKAFTLCLVSILLFAGCVVNYKVQPPYDPPEIDFDGTEVALGDESFATGKTSLDNAKIARERINESRLYNKALRSFSDALHYYHAARTMTPENRMTPIEHRIKWTIWHIEHIMKVMEHDRSAVKKKINTINESRDGLTPDERQELARLEAELGLN